jgi:hypothetical protein
LDKFGVRSDIPYEIDPGPVHMPEREQVQQVVKRKDLQLLVQKLCTVRTYPFQVFDRIAEYAGDGTDTAIYLP